MPPDVTMRTSSDPLARLRGHWEIVADGRRVWGPAPISECFAMLPEIIEEFAGFVAEAN